MNDGVRRMTPEELRRDKEFKQLCRVVSEAVNRYAMLAEGDRVLVGLSGGEDSMTLMHAMRQLQRRAPIRFEVVAATVDMGFANFDAEALRQYCEKWQWPWEYVKIPGAELLRDKGAEERPCAMCSRLRRGQLHAVADRLGCNKIALGQQLDDLCVSLLMALLRGGGLKTMGPNVAADAGSKRLIRPLCLISKEQIRQFSARMEYPQLSSCPFHERLAAEGDRHYLEGLLQQLEGQFQNVRSAMLKSMSDVRLAHLLDKRYLDFSANDDPDDGKL